MNAYLDFLQYPVMDAIGVALLHFIWQGAVVAGLLALVLYVFKHINANTRYALCAGALLLMFLLPVATALQHYYSVPNHDITPSGTVLPGDQLFNGTPFEGSGGEMLTSAQSQKPLMVPADEASSILTQNESLLDRITTQIAEWRPFAVMVWVLGLVFFVLRLINGLLTVRGLRRRALPMIGASDIHAPIATIFNALQAKMGIGNTVAVATSDEIKQPLLIGWLKPMILLPASIIAGLPADQLEAILAHELAHVRRHDYLVLLGQSIVETLFFYHPAVWWVSARMGIEREYCCDEIAVATVQNRVVYMQALARLETNRLNHQLSLGASGGRLVDRVRHLVNPQQQARPQVNRASWITLIVLLLGCGSLFAACKRVSVYEHLPAEELFNQASELARAGQYGAAERTAEIAAEKGNLCSMELLAEILYPKSGLIGLKGGAWLPPVKWVGQSDRKSSYWAHVYVDAMTLEAEAGNSDAMLLLFSAFSSDSEMDWRHYIGKEDSTARMWLSRAVEHGNADALLWYALMYLDKDEKEEKRRLFKEAALKGSDRAFIFWALHNGNKIEDPVPYFEVGQAAIERKAAGVYEWLGKDLNALEKQVLMGNEEAVAWMAIADSMQLREKLAALPEKNPDVYQHPFCPGTKHWRHP